MQILACAKIRCFPRVNCYKGWKFWILGVPNHRETFSDGTERAHPIMIFCIFDQKLTPTESRSTFRVNWLPLISIMDSDVVDKDGNQLDHKPSSQEVDELFAASEYLLKAGASYCFTNRNHRLWSMVTWSKK